MQMFDRTVIYTGVASVTAGNVSEVLTKAMSVHYKNLNDFYCELF